MRKEMGGVVRAAGPSTATCSDARTRSPTCWRSRRRRRTSLDAEDEVSARFRQAHNNIGDTSIDNVGKEILKERAEIDVILRNWRIVFFAIAGVSLLIGGVGIFSVLKISISERLFEIGLRKSMGATDSEIFMQFLIESITLSVAGAAVGLGLGIGLVKAIGGFFPGGMPVSHVRHPRSPPASPSASASSPASTRRISAARLQPVEALRA